ncbi:MAG: secondary thiamine-phosphate synthase enzyme YjbQ [Candidatus Omnitrophica bacterium]|nr:secondary thiamine-phosphate synthase enzyme YjbQ [Candidatus Omnitrophota bacterium]
MVLTKYISVETKGNTDIIDITPECEDVVKSSGMFSGVLVVFNPGSTGSLTTIEYEPNLIVDVKDALELIAPSDKVYEHSKTWHDDNGHSHVKATIMGPSITVPFVEKKLTLGTWQQIIFCDFDTRSRKRRLVAQIIGE